MARRILFFVSTQRVCRAERASLRMTCVYRSWAARRLFQATHVETCARHRTDGSHVARGGGGDAENHVSKVLQYIALTFPGVLHGRGVHRWVMDRAPRWERREPLMLLKTANLFMKPCTHGVCNSACSGRHVVRLTFSPITFTCLDCWHAG